MGKVQQHLLAAFLLALPGAAQKFYPDDPPLEHISNCPGINRPVKAGERLRFDAIYTNDRARSGCAPTKWADTSPPIERPTRSTGSRQPSESRSWTS